MDDTRKRSIVPPDDLEVFDKRRPSPSQKPAVTVMANGSISYNPAAYESLGKPEAVEYLYSPRDRILGFKPSTQDNSLAYPVYPQGGSKRNFQSSGKSFYRHYGLPLGSAFRYSAQLIEGTLYIDLRDDEAIPVGRHQPGKHDEAE